MDVDFLQALTQAPGPTGFEGPVARLVHERLAEVGIGELAGEFFCTSMCNKRPHRPCVFFESYLFPA